METEWNKSQKNELSLVKNIPNIMKTCEALRGDTYYDSRRTGCAQLAKLLKCVRTKSNTTDCQYLKFKRHDIVLNEAINDIFPIKGSIYYDLKSVTCEKNAVKDHIKN